MPELDELKRGMRGLLRLNEMKGTGLPTLSIKEMVDRAETKLANDLSPLERVETMLDKGYYDWNEGSILHGLGGEDQHRILETLRRIDLVDLVRRSGDDLPWLKQNRTIKEFLAQSGSTGIAGAAYLVPDKIYQIMFDSSVEADIVADISIAVIPPEQIPGSTLKVDIAVDGSYVPKKYSSGGAMPSETIKTTQATLDFTPTNAAVWGINFPITNDLIEDSQFDVIEMHLRNAAREMGEFATNEAVTVLVTSTDGDGTLNTQGAAANSTTLSHVYQAVMENLKDHYVSDIFLTSHHQMYDAINQDTTFTQDATTFRDEIVREAYPKRLLGCNVIYSECSALSTSATTGTAYEDLDSFILTKDYSLLSGRKRWLRIEKYSDPLRDLVGATVTARQDSVSVYNDSICRIRET